ncbi:IS110 family transposase [Endozoicomonas ascidiicola]|uniref:IS110 family transposase n=1 Tax=Endozoicomonas ascidiicola TaxID=1698521 RepID=UPI0008373B24|nr:IS110 family transposase [Endozoicomonas ascidiicola]
MGKINKSGANQKGQVAFLGIDLSKKSFQLHGVDAKGNVVFKKKLNRKALLPFIANLPKCVIGIEACGGSHYWCRKFTEMGHEVRIIAPQFVKPYVKSNKNDAADAEAICEAMQRPSMRFVPTKTMEQQDIQSLHRIRSQAVARRTALGNQIRGLLMEYGVIIPKGISYIRKQIPLVLEDAENGLTVLFRELLNELYEEMKHLYKRVEKLEQKLETIAANNEACQLLLTIPGIGLLSATAMYAAIGDITAFKTGRELAAWMGLVPKQASTGGVPTLLGISKRGDTYLRTLLIHGGRTVVRVADKHDDKRNNWIKELDKRRGKNISAVAVANKNARIAWAVLTKKEPYKAAA